MDSSRSAMSQISENIPPPLPTTKTTPLSPSSKPSSIIHHPSSIIHHPSSTYTPFRVIVAACDTPQGTLGIGFQNTLPWHIKEEVQYFKSITSTTYSPSPVEAGGQNGPHSPMQNAVIMGRTTWESLPASRRPLPTRFNIILSRNLSFIDMIACTYSKNACVAVQSLDEALAMLTVRLSTDIESIFVIGGAQVYSEALSRPDCQGVILSKVSSCLPVPLVTDTTLPPLDNHHYERVQSSVMSLSSTTDYTVTVETWLTRHPSPSHEEYQYLNLVSQIIQNGNLKQDRTGTGTRSIFGANMRFSLRNGTLPLLTTKRVFWRGVVEELLWFISGCTDNNVLNSKGVHIWDDNSSRAFLDSRGLTDREEGDLGPIYGFQWRHFGAKYLTRHSDYTNQGVDQLQQLIHTIQTNPNDRRMILSAWNPVAIPGMALPPCHILAQFYVYNGELSCQMYQRSADMGLGVPFNIASYALLTHMLAYVTGLVPGDLIHVLGDAHVYLNHVEPLQQQLGVFPRPFPKLQIRGNEGRDIDGFSMDSFEIIDYYPAKAIKMKMAV